MARFYFVGAVSEFGVINFPLCVQQGGGVNEAEALGFAVMAEFESRGLSARGAEFCWDTRAAVEGGASIDTLGRFCADEIGAEEFADLAERGLVCSECGADIHGPRSWVRGEGEESRAYHPACADAVERALRIEDYFAGYDTLATVDLGGEG